MKRLAILLLALAAGARAQDTVAKPAGYKLEEHLPADFNVFLSFDSGQKFFEGYDKSASEKFIRTARREILRALRLGDGLSIPEIGIVGALGMVTHHVEKCRGQVAVAVRAQPWDPEEEVDIVVSGDFDDEKAAENAFKMIPFGKGEHEPLVVRDGARLSIYTSAEIRKEVADTGAAKALAASEFFAEARKTTPGPAFLWLDLRGYWQMIPDDDTLDAIVDAIGVRSIRGFSASIAVTKDAVDLSQVLYLTPKAGGVLGKLAALENAPVDLRDAPAASKMVYSFTPKFIACQAEIMRLMYEPLGTMDQPGVRESLELMDLMAKTEKPMGGCFLVEGKNVGGCAWVEKAEDYVKTMREVMGKAGIKYAKESRDGLDIYVGEGDDNPVAEMMLTFGSAIAACDDRYYFGFDADSVAATHKLVTGGKGGAFADEATFKALLGDRKLEGWGFFYIDGPTLTTFIERLIPAMKNVQPMAEETWKSIAAVLKEAGSGYDVVSSRGGNLVIESRSTTGVTIGSSIWGAVVGVSFLRASTAAGGAMAVQRCHANMESMKAGLAKWSTDVAETPGDYPTERGHTIWTRLRQDGVLSAGTLTCPVTSLPYRGPVGDLNKLGPKDVIVLCSHGMESKVLLKDGTIDDIDFATEEHMAAQQQTCMVPPLVRHERTLFFKGPNDATLTLDVKEFGITDGVESVVYESKGGDAPVVREVLAVTDTGVRILRREVDGKAVPMPPTDRVTAKTFENLRGKKPVAKGMALRTLSENYYNAREVIEREMSKDEVLSTYLYYVQSSAAQQFAPVKIAYPLEKGKTWSNAYGEKGEVLDAGKVKTPDGDVRAWRIKLESSDGKSRELWWSDQLHAPLEVGDYKIEKIDK